MVITTSASKLKVFVRKLVTDDCPVCQKKVELVFGDLVALVDSTRININGIPMLECTECHHQVLTNWSKDCLLWAFEECRTNKQTDVEITLKPSNARYNYCSTYGFTYDARDYENIPGLGTNGDGFLTPVFFKKESLIYFMHHPDYELNLGSDTYGVLEYKKQSSIAFGINTNGKVVMWLGDLDQMDDDTLRFLLSQNVPSDHTLIASQFYDAQLNCQWSDPIIEAEIVNLRNRFYELAKGKRGLDLYHLDDEVVEVFESIKKPIVFSEGEINSVLASLQKILIEAINLNAFKAYYRAETGTEPPSSWKSIKYIEWLLARQTHKDIRVLMSGLYVLQDLRNMLSHLVSIRQQEAIRKNAVDAFGLQGYDLPQIYNILMDRLRSLYAELVETI